LILSRLAIAGGGRRERGKIMTSVKGELGERVSFVFGELTHAVAPLPGKKQHERKSLGWKGGEGGHRGSRRKTVIRLALRKGKSSKSGSVS